MNKEYKIGDMVWVMFENKPTQFEITSIAKEKTIKNKYNWDEPEETSYNIVYGLDYKEYIPAHGLYFLNQYRDIKYVSKHFLSIDKFFDTKEELLKSYE